MAITDKVIELETKKTGRNVALIVIAAVMLALAAAMVVLYVTKETPTEPPSVEMIALASSDLHTDTDANSNDIMYKVAPGATYTLYLDAIIKSGYKPEEVSPLLKYDCDVTGVLDASSDIKLISPQEELDPDSDDENKPYYYRHMFVFTVNSTSLAGTQFNITISSEFSEEVRTVLKCLVAESYTEHFDLVTDKDNNYLLESFHYENSTQRVDGAPALLTLQEGSTESVYHYAFTEAIPFYPAELRSLNNTYVVNFEQLGKPGTHGSGFAKVMKGTGVGGPRDQVRVSIADYNEKDKTYGEYKESSTNVITLTKQSPYCYSYIWFSANAVGKARIKLEANVYNNSTFKPQIIIDVEFVSYESLDFVSKIIFNDPYTGKETTTLDLYLDNDISSTKSFVLSDFISVRKGSVLDRNPSWSQANAIYAFVSDANGNAVSSTSSTITRGDGGDFAIKMRSSNADTSTAYVTVFDNDKSNPLQNVRTIIKINIHGSIDDVKVTSLQSVIDKKYGSGDEGEIDIEYTAGQGVAAKDFATYSKSLMSYLTVVYPASLAQPKVNSGGEVTNEDKTVVFDGFSVIDGASKDEQEIRLTPDLTQNATNLAALAAKIGFKIGKDVANGDYVFTFRLAPQGLKKTDEGYSELARSEFNLTISITKLADSIDINKDFEFSSATHDEYTELDATDKDGGVTNAKLTIAIGTGLSGYTGFTLKDLLKYVYDDGESSTKDEYNLNFDKVSVSTTSGASLNGIFRAGNFKNEFIVPAEHTPGRSIDIKFDGVIRIKLYIEYRYAVGKVTLAEGEEADWTGSNKDFIREMSYDSSKSTTLGNDSYDNIKLYSTNNKQISAMDYMLHPEKFAVDIAIVLRGSEPHLLKKAQIGDYTYYFYDDVEDDAIKAMVDSGNMTEAESKAYFRAAKSVSLADYNITVIGDLFALSVARTKKANEGGLEKADVSLLTVRVYYSYNVEEIATSSTGIVTQEHKAIMTPEEDFLFVCSTYKLVRSFDALRLYKDATYSEELEKESDEEDGIDRYKLSLFSGNYVDLFYSGIINYDGGEFIVELENTCDIPVNGYVLSYKVDNMLSEIDGRPYVQCAPEDGMQTRQITVYEIDSLKNREKSRVVNVSFANNVVNIEKIELFTSEERNEPLTSVVVYTNSNESKNIDIYYTITYAKYHILNKEYDDVVPSWDESIFTRNSNSDTHPSTAIVPGTPDEYVHIVKQHLILTLNSGVENGDYLFTAKAASSSKDLVTLKITVSTKVDDHSLKVAVDGGDTEFGVGGGHTVDFNYEVKSTNKHTFDFDFENDDGTTIDRNSLSFKATLTDRADRPFGEEVAVSGYFASDTQNFPEGGAEHAISKYVLVLPNVSVKGGKLKLTVTQNGVNYDIMIEFNVHVPVTDAELKIDGSAPETDTFAVVTSGYGEDGYQDFELSYVVNKDDSVRQPDGLTVTYSLKSAESVSGIYEIANGNKLRVYHSALKVDTEVKLVLTALDSVTHTTKVVEITLTLTTKKVILKFKNEELESGERTQYDNGDFNYLAELINAGTGRVVDGKIDYSYSVNSGSITVTQNQSTSSRFNPHGNYGTFTVTASYTVPDGKTSKISVTVHVIVPVSSVTLNLGESADTLTSLALLKDQNTLNLVKVKVGSTVIGIAPVVTRTTVTSSADGIAKVAYDSEQGVITVTPCGKGSATVTVTVYTEDGDYSKSAEAEFTVEVYEPTLSLSLRNGSDKYDISDFGASDASRRIRLNTSLTDAGPYVSEYKIEKTDFTLTGSALSVEYTSGLGWYVLVPASLTSSAVTEYNLTLTIKIQGVSYTDSCVFSLVNEKFEPSMQIELNEAVQSDDGSGFVVIDKAKSVYKAVSTSSVPVIVGEGEHDVKFSSSLDSVTVDDKSGVISGLSGVSVGTTFTVTMNTTLLGKSYTTTVNCMVMDTTAMTTELYLADDFSISVNEGGVSGGIKVGEEAYVDYASNTKYLVVVTKFANAPKAVKDVESVADFEVSTNSNLDNLNKTRYEKYVVADKDFYFVAYFAVSGAGKILISVHSPMIGGTFYAAPAVEATLKTHDPEFKMDTEFNKDSEKVGTLDPGQSGKIILSLTDNGFKGDVEYELESDTYKLLKVTAGAKGEFTVNANVNVGGGTETVRITAKVTNGAYKGYTKTFTVPVAVNSYRAPTVSDVSSPMLGASETFNIKDAIGKAIVKDEKDTEFAFTVTEIPTVSPGSISSETVVYTAPDTCENGAHFTTGTMKVNITGGFYKGTTLFVSATITVKPTAVTLTADKAEVLPGETVKLSAKLGNGTGSIEGGYKVAYSLEATDAGWLRADSSDEDAAIFTANQYGGSVTVKATISVVNGPYAGATYTKDVTIAVNGLTLKSDSKLSAKVGGSCDISSLLQAGGEDISGGTFTIDTGSDPAISASGSTITVNSNAKYANKTVHIKVTYLSGSKTYKGEFDFTVEELEVPALEVEKSTAPIYTVKEIDGAQYMLEIVSGEDLVTLGGSYGEYSSTRTFTVTPREDTVGGVAIVRISMKIEGGIYAGTSYVNKVYTETFEIIVEASTEIPELTVSIVDAVGDEGRIQVKATRGYEVSASDIAYSVSDSTHIIVDSLGNYTLKRDKTATTVTVTVRAIVHKLGAPYDGMVLEATTEPITVGAESDSNIGFKAELKYGQSGDAYIDVTASNMISKSFSVDQSQSRYINIDSNGKLTLIYGADIPDEIVVTVTVTVKSGFTTRTSSTTVKVSTKTAKPAPTGVSLSKSAPNALDGTFVFEIDSAKVEIISVSANSPYLTVVGKDGFRLTPDDEDHNDVKVTVQYLVIGGVWKGNIFTYDTTVTVEKLVPPTLSASVTFNEGGMSGTITATLSSDSDDARYFFTLTSGTGIKLYSDGKFDVVGADTNVIKITAITKSGSIVETTYTLKTMTVSASYSDGKITVTFTGGTATYEYSVPEEFSEYVEVGTDGSVTVKKHDEDAVTVTITVKATVTGDVGAYSDVVITCTVDVLVEAQALEPEEEDEEEERREEEDLDLAA